MLKPEQVLTVHINEGVYAIDSDLIVQILRVPDITTVPFTDASLRGICPVEGSILNVFDCNILLDSSCRSVDISDDSSRILTLKEGEKSYALLVDSVINNIGLHEYEYESATEASEVIGAVLKKEQEIIQLIDVTQLFSGVGEVQFNRQAIKEIARDVGHLEGTYDQGCKHLFFKLGREKFGIEASMVREIILFQQNMTAISNSPEHILGMITIRGQVMTAIDLCVLLQFPLTSSAERRILVIQHEGELLGLVVDQILDIRDIYPDEMENLPENYRRNKFSGIVKLEDELVSVLDNRFVLSLLEMANDYDSESSSVVEEQEGDDQETREVVAFFLGNQEYGILIKEVSEIIRFTEITAVPDVSRLIRGIINLRGQIIPIISLHGRLDIQAGDEGEDAKIIVFNRSGITAGFVVDSVSEVMHIRHDSFKTSEDGDPLVPEVILLDGGKRIISNLDLGVLVCDPEVAVSKKEEIDE